MLNDLSRYCQKVVKNTLVQNELPATESAIRLLCMVAAHESSGFKYARQIRGPALGFFQMEPATFEDVSKYAMKRGLLEGSFPSPPERLVLDFPFAICMARIFFMRKPESLPLPEQLELLAEYAKKHWNTFKGKATSDMYLKAYQKQFVE